MSDTCVDFIWYTFLLGLPLLKVINLIVVWCHPIKGERLTQLYYTQGAHHQVVNGGEKKNVTTIVESSPSVLVGQRVQTLMGEGTVVETQGKVAVLELDWTLANNGKAMMFCQTTNLL